MKGLVALADVRLKPGAVVSKVGLDSGGTTLPLASKHTTVTLYTVPGDRPVTRHLVLVQAAMMHVVLGGLTGHSLTLYDTHCWLVPGLISTKALVAVAEPGSKGSMEGSLQHRGE